MPTHRPRIDVVSAPLEAILSLRDEYRRELACQIVHDSWHERGFTTSYLIHVDGRVAGYGSVGGAPRAAKDTVKEFFLLPQFRADALPLFRRLIAASGARMIEAQTNDPLLLLMLLDCAIDVSSSTILFADGSVTNHALPNVVFRRLKTADREAVFAHEREGVGEYGLECDGVVAATGGVTFHYNAPYADLYMEVAPAYRRRGLGSYLVQELKRITYELACIPAARCDDANVASRLTLQRGGMLPCARIVEGRIRH